MVWSVSSFLPPILAPRCLLTALISPMNTMNGPLAFSNRSLALDAPTPTKSLPNTDMALEKNYTPAFPARR